MLSLPYWLVAFLLTVSVAQAQNPGTSTIRGQILANPDRLAEPLEVLLRKRGKIVANTLSDKSGRYEFHDLATGSYDVVVKVKGKEARQHADLACGRNGLSFVVVVLDKNDTPRVSVSFPIEDPDVIDIAEAGHAYPKDVLNGYERAREDYRSGNLARAAQRLEAVLQQAPDFYNAHARLGMVYQHMGCYSDAEEQYVQARDLSPRSAQPLVNLASLHIQAADTGLDSESHLIEARRVLEQAIKIKPTSAISYCLLGETYYKSASYEEAEKDLKHALQIQPHMAAAHLMLANLYMRQENWKAATGKLDDYLRENLLAPDVDQIKSIRSRLAQNSK